MATGAYLPGKAVLMPLQLTMCRLCTRSRPEFLRAINQLVASYPREIEVVELECMAACDDVPAIMIETDYYPQISPQNLVSLVREMLQLVL
jgi:NADH:ubiquinone oxidoreductase subunit E